MFTVINWLFEIPLLPLLEGGELDPVYLFSDILSLGRHSPKPKKRILTVGKNLFLGTVAVSS